MEEPIIDLTEVEQALVDRAVAESLTSSAPTDPLPTFVLINPRRTCAARVTVLGLCVYLSVC